jgi:two-component system OmpR family sensor kinase
LKRWWLLGLLPFLLGIAIRLAHAQEWLESPIYYLKADRGTVVLLLGFFLSVLAGIGIAGWERVSRLRDLRITNLKEESAADRRRFLQRLDHELKNPLTAIQAGLANLGGFSNPDALETVKAQTLRLSRLVADLRKLADLETRALEHSSVDLGEVLETVVEFAEEDATAIDRRISLILPQAPWPLPEVAGDYDLLVLATHNLLNNAVKFTKPGDTVEVRAFEDGSTVVVEVADTGPGIPEDEISHVWQELYRGKGARGVPGSGLGLALVRAIIERHGGQVSVRSRVGRGTVVTIRLPLGNVTTL